MPQFSLADGVVIDTDSGQAITPTVSAEKVEKENRRERNASELGRDRSNKPVRVSIGELPADPRAITTVGVVWLYWSLGLSDFDISDATGLTNKQVESVKGLTLFNTIQNLVTNNLTKLGEEDIHQRIAALAPKALDELEAIVGDAGVDANIKSKVAADLLDRAGYAPKQITEHRHKHEGGLIIRYMRESVIDADKMPRVQIDRDGAIDA